MAAEFVDVGLLADQALALLRTVAAVDVFDGEVDEPNRDPDGGIHANAVFYPGAGRRFSNRFSGAVGVLAFQFQVTCTGADRQQALGCVHEVTSVLTGARLTVDGRQTGLIKELGDPGPIRPDKRVHPPEMYAAIDYGVFVSR